MRWRHSLVFRIVLAPSLAFLAFAGVQLFYALSYPPTVLWYAAWTCGIVALVWAVHFGFRLHRRLDYLYKFVSIVPQRDLVPSLAVWDDDELSLVERSLHRLLVQQADRLQILQSERKQIEAVLQSMADGVVVVDLAGRVVLCNRTSRELFGVDLNEEVTGKPLQAFSRHPWLHELLRDVANLRSSAQPIMREIDIEEPERRYLAVSAMQLSENGTVANGSVLVFHDVTQLKRLEAVRADFVANVSHELRTPLTAIKGYAETLLNGALQDTNIARRFLTIIDRHSERLSRLIDDLLTLSNLELGRTELRREEVILNDVVSEVLEVVRDKAERGKVTLVQDLPAELPSVTGDNDRIHQVLINLIDNAVKYTPEGGTVTVTAEVVQAFGDQDRRPDGTWNGEGKRAQVNGEAPPMQEWLEVAVTDTGCGIPEADIPRLTQRFYRVDKARSRDLGGTGLGLAIVKHIVQAHGGSLKIKSQLNKGTRMCFSLPLHPAIVPNTTQTGEEAVSL